MCFRYRKDTGFRACSQTFLRKKAFVRNYFVPLQRSCNTSINYMRMKKLLLTSLLALAAITTQAQIQFEWGTASWNIENGRVYENIQEYNASPAVLSFPNPTGYTLGFFQIIALKYDIFIDDSTTPITASASARQSTDVALIYDFIEGHNYRIVVNEEQLCQANIATYSTDTLSTCNDKYTISFRINGPELVKTYDYKAIMSLAITDQNWQLTYSKLDTEDMCAALGINDITEAKFIGLNANGSYNKAFISPEYGYDFFDGWRDAEGGYTVWGGGAGGGAYDLVGGHNPYPAVYCIKLNESMDSLFYFFYDYWREYDPEDPGEIPGTGSDTGVKQQGAKLAPETHYNSVVWDWEEEDGTIKQYTRNYRCDEGSEYHASFIFKTEEKAVKVNATMLFVSVEDYESTLTGIANPQYKTTAKPNTLYNIAGMRQNTLTKGLNIVVDGDGNTRKVFVK